MIAILQNKGTTPTTLKSKQNVGLSFKLSQSVQLCFFPSDFGEFPIQKSRR